jgi:hypothetical protein
MLHSIQVLQEQMVVVPVTHPQIALMTKGVSTCLCLMAKGYVAGQPYLAMYHWDGFALSFNKAAHDASERAVLEIAGVLTHFSRKIMKTMKPYNATKDKLPNLSELYVVGGERAAPGLSGTELEVESLRESVQVLCSHLFAISPKTRFADDYYRTKGTDAVNILFGFESIKVLPDTVDDSDFESDIEEDERSCFSCR